MTLSTEVILPTNTEIYHYSRLLNELLLSGKFDSSHSQHDGAIFFTLDMAIRTNCSARVAENLRLFDFTTLPDEELSTLKTEGNGNFWAGSANLGYDGRLYAVPDSFAEIESGRHSTELVIFKESLYKVVDLRPVGI